MWEGRYKATVLDSDQYLLVCSRYIELNTVRAGMVRRPDDYPWSSCTFNALALGKENKLLTPHSLYMALVGDLTKRHEAYRALFAHHIPDSTLNDIREATNKAWVMGDGRSQEEIERLVQR